MDVSGSITHKRAILQYWTLVEFFSPYLLDNILGSNHHYDRVFAEDAIDLPWSNERALAEDDPASTFAKGYHLYLGIFSTEETADRARHVFCQEPNPWQSIDWRQCGAPSTLSCFARLTVTKFGTPLFRTLTLSTLPWAHGRLLDNEAKSLAMETYWKGTHKLLDDIKEEFVDTLPKRLVRMPKEYAASLDHEALVKLVDILFRWAGYAPKDYPIAIVEPIYSDAGGSAAAATIDSAQAVPILNSFYIQDLERARASLDFQRGTPLDLYLNGSCRQRVLLNGEDGREVVFKALKPSLLPEGRWPASTSNHLSLMQQFAVNQALSSLDGGGLFSVNGPPGTGKTTLLREVVAHNIVERAKALAQFKSAKDAFVGRRALGFESHEPVFVSDLHPTLLGYEMVVASSNNTAVQNLSHELPLRRELDPSYAHASYLEPVACKLLGVEKNQAWGLVSAALGNMKNCRQLVERVFITSSDAEGGARIWDWVRDYDGPSFPEARDRFLKVKDKHRALLADFNLLADLHEEKTEERLEVLYENALNDLVCAEKTAEKLGGALHQLEKEVKEAQELVAILEQRVQLWQKERPNIVKRFVGGSEWDEWSEKSSAYTHEQIAALEGLHVHKSRRGEHRKKLESLRGEIETKELRLLECGFWVHWRKGEYARLKEIYPDVLMPDVTHEIDQPEVQKQVFYQNVELNDCRSELFIEAFALHEAWLAETLRPKGGFRGNLMAVSRLLQGNSPTTTDDTRLAWQSVFLVIPLISSTFASFQRLFRYLEPQNLGWLFIDEAGQALPQAAVGAIWRAKRVLSIGDPFQIEPISTVSPEIIDGMAKDRLRDHCLAWAPSQISVQNLMDAATQHGSNRHVRDTPCWLGSPLRVHRRCIEPMFSIANAIAYEGSMVLATPSDTDCTLPASCWYDVRGAVADRQYVPAQGEALLQRLIEALSIMSAPNLYVISPFREVVRQVQHLICCNKILKKLFENKFDGTPLRLWTQEAVGTVHSFQGKQAAAVFFILGADQTTLGSIDWATRKPNLLNVAVTRACQRFYIVGDYDLWQKWPYFDVATEKLERKVVKPDFPTPHSLS